jgi:hypothetical protein
VLFYLGTHVPAHLARTDVPLFLSRRTLAPRKTLPHALGRWALDSGGFSELSMHGEWRTPARQYVEEVRRFRDEIGGMDWAAIQDWMCEPFITEKTGLSVAEHQKRTIESLLDLRSRAPDLPWTPVLQGWRSVDYLRHAEAYSLAGIDLRKEPIVGVGSVCRRQSGVDAARVLWRLHTLGIRLHGFGVKLGGLASSADVLTSADSMAWSFGARRSAPLPGCTHKNCANCLRFALEWREKVLATIARRPLTFFSLVA